MCKENYEDKAPIDDMTNEMTAFINDMCIAKKLPSGQLQLSRQDTNNMRFITRNFNDQTKDMLQLQLQPVNR